MFVTVIASGSKPLERGDSSSSCECRSEWVGDGFWRVKMLTLLPIVRSCPGEKTGGNLGRSGTLPCAVRHSWKVFQRSEIRQRRVGFRALIFVMPGGGHVVGVLLAAPLEAEEVPIAAAALAGKRPADPRARLIDGAAAGLGVEEPADAAEMRVLLAPHDATMAMFRGGEPALGFLVGHPEMAGDAGEVETRDHDHRIGAAIARAFEAVVKLRHCRSVFPAVRPSGWQSGDGFPPSRR